ncbi:hypothetical protein BSKO_10825 [Bryopsis sp. KO-2023]|nr:hypothetical protein BSKO_10825 [Bryopsis sp. KO-2023]
MGSCGVWFEEEIQPDLKWSFSVDSIYHHGKSKFQDVHMIKTGPFGKVLVLDGKLQSAEADEFVYHELLVHPALLSHPNPRSVFICGGGEGSTAREVLKHKSVERCVMVDIDEVVCDVCSKELEENLAAFEDPRLDLIIDDAGGTLENSTEKFDVIIGDLADPVFGGPCYHLYTQDFYQRVVKSKLREGGIFVTQSGPAGVLSCGEVFSPINNTLSSVFPTVIPYTQHMPSFADTWGWNMAFTDPSQPILTPTQLDAKIQDSIQGELKFLDGATWTGVSSLNKIVRGKVDDETHIYSKDNPRFIHGQGIKTLA